MASPASIDYLVVGHVTQDVSPEGERSPGGTAAYAALIARALGLRPAIVTSFGPDAVLGPLAPIEMAVVPTSTSSVFENIYFPQGRAQRLISRAAELDARSVPVSWLGASVVHLGPVADEVSWDIARAAGQAGARCVGVTPQGWMRSWDGGGRVYRRRWLDFGRLAELATAVVFSEEDVNHDEDVIEELRAVFPLVVVTMGARGARLLRRGSEPVSLAAPRRREVDPTGAGDVFAAAFFSLLSLGAPVERAAELAVLLAADSVEGPGLAGIPSQRRAREVLLGANLDLQR